LPYTPTGSGIIINPPNIPNEYINTTGGSAGTRQNLSIIDSGSLLDSPQYTSSYNSTSLKGVALIGKILANTIKTNSDMTCRGALNLSNGINFTYDTLPMSMSFNPTQVGYIINGSINSTMTATNVYYEISNITLPVGVWALYYQYGLNITGAAMSSQAFEFGISLSTASIGVYGCIKQSCALSYAIASPSLIVNTSCNVCSSFSQTYYLNGRIIRTSASLATNIPITSFTAMRIA
jgi:hypothetical protein